MQHFDEMESFVLVDDDLQRLSAEELEELIASLPTQRREAVMAYHHDTGRRQGALAYDLLCRALRERFGITEQPTFAFGPHGKPSLTDHPYIHFNMSHCAVAVAVAVSTRPVGIDIESIRKARPELVRHTMNGEEAETILGATSPDVEFTRLWTRKEALVKLDGGTAAADLRDLLTDAPMGVNIQTMVTKSYIMSVAE